MSIGELNYSLVIGYIGFERTKREISVSSGSPDLLVKYFEISNLLLSLRWGFAPLNQELNFFERVLPVLDQMGPTKQLFVELCTFSICATPISKKIAIMFEYPTRARLFKKWSFGPLNLGQCWLMLQKIARFHARSLQLQSANPDLFEGLNFNPQPAQFDLPMVLPILIRCLRQLQQKYVGTLFPSFEEGVSRFDAMLQNFEGLLRVPFVRSSACNHC